MKLNETDWRKTISCHGCQHEYPAVRLFPGEIDVCTVEKPEDGPMDIWMVPYAVCPECAAYHCAEFTTS